MTIEFNLPSPQSVQATATSEAQDEASNRLLHDESIDFRLLTADGLLFTQLSELQAIALFPAAFNAFVASGKDHVPLRDIPEFLLNEVIAALHSAGWYTEYCSYGNVLAMESFIAVPYTTMPYVAVCHLAWRGEPFPPTFEEMLWCWLKSWFV